MLTLQTQKALSNSSLSRVHLIDPKTDQTPSGKHKSAIIRVVDIVLKVSYSIRILSLNKMFNQQKTVTRQINM